MTKLEVVQKITDYDIPVKRLNEIDKRLHQYIDEVLSHPDDHNKYEILGVFRFLDFLQKYEFRDKEAKKFFTFYECLKFPSNKGMKSFKLTPMQVFVFSHIYGFYKEDGNRLTRDALLFIPRKWSKTTSVSACAIYDLLFGENDAQAYVASNSFSQSQIGFEIVKNSLKALDPKLSHFRLNRDIIYNKMPDKTSLIRCLASSADRLDGLNASTVICDEFAQADSAALRNVLTSSMGIRKNPLVITITTASSKLDTPFTQMLSNYKKVLEGDFENDSIFASIFQADEDDDIGDPKTWRKVQPHLGITVNEDFYRAEYQKALMSAEDMLEFKCKLLNIFTLPTNQQWVNPKVIERNTQHFDFSLLKSRPNAMVSVDLSVKDDNSCVTYSLYDSINKRFIFKSFYYIPRQTIETHPNREMYQRLVDEGHLIVCGEDVIDYRQIANDIIANNKYLNILQVGYDAYKSKEFVNILRASGMKNTIPVSQTYGNFTSAVDSFEIGVHQDRMKFDDNPMILYNFNNVAIDVDRMGNRKPIKKTAIGKIDGVVTILMCLILFNNYKR